MIERSSDPRVILRPITSDDGLAAAELAAQNQSTAGGLVRSHRQYHPDYVPLALEQGAVGVVAEVPGRPGIVGIMWMSTGECWYEGTLLPYAYFYNKVVHPACRRRGIGVQLSAWLLAEADKRLGRERVTFGCVAPENKASVAGGKRWVTQRLDGRAVRVIVGTRRRPPRPIAGLEVRPVAPAELEEYAQRQNECFFDHNLYPPQTAESMGRRLLPLPLGRSVREAFVAADRQGRLLAGLELSESGRLAPLVVEGIAWPIRAANTVVRLIPPDGLVKPILVSSYWYAMGAEAAAVHLWENVRWLWRERGNLMTINHDPRSLLARAVPRAWFGRARVSALFMAAPIPMGEDRSIYVQHV